MSAISHQLETHQPCKLRFQFHNDEVDPKKIIMYYDEETNPLAVTRVAFNALRSLIALHAESGTTSTSTFPLFYTSHNLKTLNPIIISTEELLIYLETAAQCKSYLTIDEESVQSYHSIAANRFIKLIKSPFNTPTAFPINSIIEIWSINKFILLETSEGTKLCTNIPIDPKMPQVETPSFQQYIEIASLGFAPLLISQINTPLSDSALSAPERHFHLIDLNPKYNMHPDLAIKIKCKAHELSALLLQGRKAEYKSAIQSIYNGECTLFKLDSQPLCIPISKYSLPAYWISYFLFTDKFPNIDLINELVQADPYWQQLGVASIHPDTIISTIEAYQASLNPFMSIIPSASLYITSDNPLKESFATLGSSPQEVRIFREDSVPLIHGVPLEEEAE